ncbi:hypothetical protein D3C87_1078100 [compost metagenome]
MVAAEQGVLFAQDEGHVVGGVAGRGHGLDGPAVALDPVAVVQDDVGLEVGVVVLVHRRLIHLIRGVDRRAVRRSGQDGRAADGLSQGARERRVVAVGVGHQDMADRPPLHRPQQGVQVGFVLGARIDHRHARIRHIAPDDIGSRSGEGEGTRIIGDDPLDQRRNLIAMAVGEVELANIGDHGRASSGGDSGQRDADLAFNACNSIRRRRREPNGRFSRGRRLSALIPVVR